MPTGKRLIRRSLTRDLILGLTLALALLMLLLGGVFFITLTHRSGAELELRAELLSDEIAQILSRPAWNVDQDVAVNIVSAYLQNEIVVGMRLVFEPEIVVYEKPPDPEADVFVKTRSIFFNGDGLAETSVGWVEIWFSRESIHNRQMDLVRMVMITVVFSVLVTALVIHFLMSVLLRTPLNGLLQGVRSIAAGKYESSIPPVPQEDVNAIVTEINQMAECIADHTSRLSDEIRERKQIEKDLLERNQQMRTLSDNLPSGYVYQVVIGRGGQPPTFTHISAGVERLHGVSVRDILANAMVLYDQYSLEEKQRILEAEALAFENMSQFSVEVRYQPASGESRWISLTSAPRHRADGELVWDGIAMDVTQRKQAEAERERLQAQLLQSQKMESIGILAGGVAHDFNNLLHAMRGNIELLERNKSIDAQGLTRLQTVIRSLDRAAKLVQQLLLFSRKVESGRERVDVNHEVREAARMLERTIPKMIALELRLDPEAWPISGDPVQIEQILLNLAGNAVDAMPEGGKLVMETSNVVLGEAFTRLHQGSTAGRHVLLNVTDTGCGMDAATLKHVFDPFFTTKEVGQGTGLGLASVYGIVKGHGGYICCYSEPGQGTVFSIYLPATDRVQAETTDPEPASLLRGVGETILVVDDEADIRQVTTEALESSGYFVLEAASGEEALAVHAEKGRAVDLVILDLGMPGMGGRRCLLELVRHDPEVRVLISSGYATGNLAEDVRREGSAGFIRKPYQLKELLDAVRKILDNDDHVARTLSS